MESGSLASLRRGSPRIATGLWGLCSLLARSLVALLVVHPLDNFGYCRERFFFRSPQRGVGRGHPPRVVSAYQWAPGALVPSFPPEGDGGLSSIRLTPDIRRLLLGGLLVWCPRDQYQFSLGLALRYGVARRHHSDGYASSSRLVSQHHPFAIDCTDLRDATLAASLIKTAGIARPFLMFETTRGRAPWDGWRALRSGRVKRSCMCRATRVMTVAQATACEEAFGCRFTGRSGRGAAKEKGHQSGPQLRKHDLYSGCRLLTPR